MFQFIILNDKTIELGEDYNNIIKKLGKPIKEDSFGGGIYLDYQDYWIFYNTFSKEKEVTGKVLFNGQQINSLIVGESNENDVKKALGEPNDETNGIWSEDEDIISSDKNSNYLYENNGYEAYFYFVDGVLQQVYIRKSY
ncbi:MAG: hypothetical protein CVU87_13065 [Firmicutes bacterium HGW-Firmicutes-12]|jgi:hypothetical protein|nr:MAG: hypothetical protein CVU87_13065 [Firmicutes bacterium HGW-Firmicutes-12]